MDQLIRCKLCGKQVASMAEKCPQCRVLYSGGLRNPKLIISIVALVFGVVLAIVGMGLSYLFNR